MTRAVLRHRVLVAVGAVRTPDRSAGCLDSVGGRGDRRPTVELRGMRLNTHLCVVHCIMHQEYVWPLMLWRSAYGSG